MIIHLKKNEKFFINGAVIQLDRRGSIELLNDAQFLLASHVMQPEQATTPLRQIYFIVQTMLMDPSNASLTSFVFASHIHQLKQALTSGGILDLVNSVESKVADAKYFEALKMLRAGFELERQVLEKTNSAATVTKNLEFAA